MQRQESGGVPEQFKSLVHGSAQVTGTSQYLDLTHGFDDLAALCLCQDFSKRHGAIPPVIWKLFTRRDHCSTPVRAEQDIVNIVAHLLHDFCIGLVGLSFDQRFVQLADPIRLFGWNHLGVCHL